MSLLLLSNCTARRDQSDAIRIRWAHDPETLTPLALQNQAAMDASNLMHVSLLQANSQPLAIEPALAAQLPTMARQGDSLTTFRYTIRPAATWDDGRPVLATDVACTLKLMSCPGLPNETARNNFGRIQQIEPDPADPRAFTLICQGQAPDLLLVTGDFFILSEASLDPRHRLRRYSLPALQRWPATRPPDSALQALARHYLAADLANHPERSPGCGPYRLARWEKDRYLSFRRKAGWWGHALSGLPLALQARAARLDYLVIPDASAANLALRRGDLDVYPQFPAADFQRLTATPTAAVRLYVSDSYDIALAGFNTRHPVLADARTRQALSRLFDTAGLLRGTQHGSGQRTASLVAPFDRANYNDSLRPVPYDPPGARALLQQAGWQPSATGWHRPGPKGLQQLHLVVRYRAEDALFATAALQFRAAAKALGIGVELLPTESALFGKALAEGDFDVFMRTLRGNPFAINFTPLLHSASPSETNATRFSNPACDRLIDAIANTNDSLARARQLRQLQGLLQWQAPLVPLFFLPNRVAARRDCQGLYVSSLKPGFVAPTIERTAAAAAR
ncbi:ABC transporter substrate-binding protein [Hymenobacter sp. DH14]|uniref:ABC transporter substrate-binding protein n=1 Tax=Hymenobacter cyanobacteriorum TaxID=2926463 RepID=A0A9X1VJT5_9BACT|nr:ABC transporter substrate-binding protein [Hymenobacter cyanobacteriorum]MCI1189943.1 ABC transporter substrate-binding protein [Hymenobacter cyanobacteriorum]